MEQGQTGLQCAYPVSQQGSEHGAGIHPDTQENHHLHQLQGAFFEIENEPELGKMIRHWSHFRHGLLTRLATDEPVVQIIEDPDPLQPQLGQHIWKPLSALKFLPGRDLADAV
ncbi:UNVERIFIED_CONTAM: hypothetical protein FKN15_024075 [Acipenser sinensis]